MTREEFEDCVSAITDNAWATLNRRACMGLSDPITVIGIEVNGFMTRDRIRAKIWEAARRTDYSILKAAA
jgi:hypothetical protein